MTTSDGFGSLQGRRPAGRPAPSLDITTLAPLRLRYARRRCFALPEANQFWFALNPAGFNSGGRRRGS